MLWRTSRETSCFGFYYHIHSRIFWHRTNESFLFDRIVVIILIVYIYRATYHPVSSLISQSYIYQSTHHLTASHSPARKTASPSTDSPIPDSRVIRTPASRRHLPDCRYCHEWATPSPSPSPQSCPRSRGSTSPRSNWRIGPVCCSARCWGRCGLCLRRWRW